MTRQHLIIGDAVVPEYQPDHDVMTVYDFEAGSTVALLNWCVGHRMFKTKAPVDKLIRLERQPNGRSPK